MSYNNVSDLSQVGMLENLQLLDLEGNDVEDLVQVQYLSLCSKLERLTLEGNPVCLRPNPTSTQVLVLCDVFVLCCSDFKQMLLLRLTYPVHLEATATEWCNAQSGSLAKDKTKPRMVAAE